MNKQREHVKKALRVCAESGVSNTIDLWPRIMKRIVAVSWPSCWEKVTTRSSGRTACDTHDGHQSCPRNRRR